jgi:hypothetical protein
MTLPYRTLSLLSAITTACNSGQRRLVGVQPTATVCYRLEFGKWVAADPTLPLAVQWRWPPLPDTVALTPTLADTAGTRRIFVALRHPDADHLGGTWTRFGGDSAVIVLRLHHESVLQVTLVGQGRVTGGSARIAPYAPSDRALLTPVTHVSAEEIQCPDSLGGVRTGA